MKQKTLLLMLGMLSALPALARDFEYTYNLQTITYTVIDEDAKTCKTKEGLSSSPGNKVSGNLVLPANPKDGKTEYTLTEISNVAFKNCIDLTSVEIPNSVQTIGGSAFMDCWNLSSVKIPNSVQTIKGLAFYNCSSLTSVKIPNSVQTIEGSVFSGCSGLTSVEIPNSVQTIGGSAFYDCSNLASVEIPNSVTEIGVSAFSGCRGLTSVVISNSIQRIRATTFKGCSRLASVEIPNSVQTIEGTAFDDCWNLSSVKILAVSPPTMYDDSFEERTYNIADLSVPDETVDNYFTTIWGLFKNIQSNSGNKFRCFSDGVLEYRLNPVDLTATIIGATDYSNLQIPERFADDSDAANPVRYYIKGIGYKAFYGKKVNSVEFNSRSQMEYIGNYAFAETKISSVTLPETMKTIGDYAFYNTENLSNVELKEGLESIGSYAFGSLSLRSASGNPLYLPSTVRSIGNNAFKCFRCSQVDISDLSAWCQIDFGNHDATPLCGSSDGLYVNSEKLTRLYVPEGIKEIKPYAFCNCKPLEEVTFPEGLEKIGTNSFISCPNLTELTIPASVVEIGYGVSAAKNVTLADGPLPISFESGVFNHATNLYLGRPVEVKDRSWSYGGLADKTLSSLTIGYLVTEIPDSLFMSESSLNSLTLGNSIQRIGNGAFSGCTSLEEVILPPSVETVGAEAFSGCTSLEEVILPPSVETVGAEAFAGNSNLEYIIMGHKVKTIGEKAFDGCKANTVSITAQTPPTAPNNTFSNYKGKLYLQGEKAKDAYYDAFTCWDRFDSYVMIEAKEIKMEGPDRISGKAGDTFQLTATVWPEDATLPQIFWRATNPEIATVDANGLVTLLVDLESLQTRAGGEGDIDGVCTIIAETLYNDGPVARIEVTAEEDAPILVKSLTIDPTVWNGVEGGEFTITATLLPEDAADKGLTFESSDTAVATVDAEGNVKVLKEGTCVITVSTVDGSNLTAECVITSLSGVEAVFADPNAQVDVYDMNGTMLKKGCSREELKQLKPAVYILRSADTVVKAIVK